MPEAQSEENQPLMADGTDGDDNQDLLRVDDAEVGDEAEDQGQDTNGHDHEPDAPLGQPHRTGDSDDSFEVEDSDPPTPRFLQDEGSWKHWKWVPFPVRRLGKAVVKWARGPVHPRPFRITPLFPKIQEYPLMLVERFLPKLKQRFWVLFIMYLIWIVAFVAVKSAGMHATQIAGWGAPKSIGCGTTYWGRGNKCGLDGSNCRPFRDSGFAFRCPANCESYQVLEPRAVGDREVVYKPLVIGGPSDDVHPEEAIYRGDSFICGAAIHAGAISNANGGCGVVKLVGTQENYISTQRHGITSIPFSSYFPLSFSFMGDITCSASDMRWNVLAISTVFTGVISLFTASPALFFFTNFIGIFWTTGMATDPPGYSTLGALFSNILGKFLPAMFCAWVIYDKMGIRRTLGGLTAQIEKCILWLGPCWVGGLNNYTLDFIPIQRLNAHDLQQQPGAKAALAIIIIILVAIVAGQVWIFRQEARFNKYIKLYALFIGGIVVSLLIPGLNLRIHHYILALLLLPGTSVQTRPALIYQGLLIGLFINGIARWGFDPVLQTSDALQGDAQKGTELPHILPPEIDIGNSSDTMSIKFNWDPPKVKTFDGISVLVNDVERYRSYFDDEPEKEDIFIWNRNSELGLPEYFRFAFMDGSKPGDYTKAGTWTDEGEWVEMKKGPSRARMKREAEEDVLLDRRETVRHH